MAVVAFSEARWYLDTPLRNRLNKPYHLSTKPGKVQTLFDFHYPKQSPHLY